MLDTLLQSIQAAMRRAHNDPVVNLSRWSTRRVYLAWESIKGAIPDPYRLPSILQGIAGAIVWLPASVLGLTDLVTRTVAQRIFGLPLRYPEMHEALPGIFIGDIDAATSEATLYGQGIQQVISLRELPCAPSELPAHVDYTVYSLEDKPGIYLHGVLKDAIRVITEARRRGEKVLVNCNMGQSRSAAVVIAYAMHTYQWTYAQALEMLKRRRAVVQPNPGFVDQLKERELKARSSGPTPIDWENVAMAVRYPEASARLQVIDGIVQTRFWFGQASEVEAALRSSLSRIQRLPWEVLTARQRVLLGKMQRIIEVQGTQSWLYRLRHHAALQTASEKQTRHVLTPLTARIPLESSAPSPVRDTERQWRAHQGEESLRHLQVGATSPFRSEQLSVQFGGEHMVYVQMGGLNFLINPDQRSNWLSPGHLRYMPPGCHAEQLQPDFLLLTQNCNSLDGSWMHEQPTLFVAPGTVSKATEQGYTQHVEFHSGCGMQIDTPGSAAQVSYLNDGWAIECNGQTVLYLGDSLHRSESDWSTLHERFPNVTLLLGDIRSPQLLELCQQLRPETVIPTHWGGGRTGRAQVETAQHALLKEVNEQQELWKQLRILHVGEVWKA